MTFSNLPKPFPVNLLFIKYNVFALNILGWFHSMSVPAGLFYAEVILTVMLSHQVRCDRKTFYNECVGGRHIQIETCMAVIKYA